MGASSSFLDCELLPLWICFGWLSKCAIHHLRWPRGVRAGGCLRSQDGVPEGISWSPSPVHCRSTHPISVTWNRTAQLYRIRQAGQLAYDFGTTVCNEWLFGKEPKNMKFGSLRLSRSGFETISFACQTLGLSLIAVGIQAFFLDEKHVILIYVFRATMVLFVMLTLFCVPLILLDFPVGQETVTPLCAQVFGKELQYGNASLSWTQAVTDQGMHLADFFAFYSASLAPPGAVTDADQLLAFTVKMYHIDGQDFYDSSAQIQDLSKACSSRSEKVAPASAASRLRTWLSIGDFQCQAVTHKDRQRITLFVSHELMTVQQARLLDAEQGAKIISLAESHAASEGWSTKRHKRYATTDIEVARSKVLREYLDHSGLNERLANEVAIRFHVPWGLQHLESFVVKYAANCTGLGCGQSELAAHMDGTNFAVLSYNILLNSASDFNGGGTLLESYDNYTVQINQGLAVTHASKLMHGGGSVTQGTRYILVGFMEFRSRLSPLLHELSVRHDLVRGALGIPFN